MLSELTIKRVEDFCRRNYAENPLFVKSEQGTLSAAAVQVYLANVRHVVSHTPLHLRRAAAAARKQGHPTSLIEFFEEKIGEEEGHDRWAEDDLAQIRTRFGELGQQDVLPSMHHIVANNEAIIDRNAARYLGYMVFSEFGTVLIGPTWLNALEKKCGVPRSMMSVVDNHAELDKEHVREDLQLLDSLETLGSSSEVFFAVLTRCMELWEKFWADVGGLKA